MDCATVEVRMVHSHFQTVRLLPHKECAEHVWIGRVSRGMLSHLELTLTFSGQLSGNPACLELALATDLNSSRMEFTPNPEMTTLSQDRDPDDNSAREPDHDQAVTDRTRRRFSRRSFFCSPCTVSSSASMSNDG